MTEIPEHLLKRAQRARETAGGPPLQVDNNVEFRPHTVAGDGSSRFAALPAETALASGSKVLLDKIDGHQRRLDHHAEELGEHSESLASHSSTLANHGRAFGRYAETFTEHRRAIGTLTAEVAKHDRAIGLHRGDIVQLQDLVGSVADAGYEHGDKIDDLYKVVGVLRLTAALSVLNSIAIIWMAFR